MLPIAPSTETRPCLETVCKNDAPRMIHLDATGGEAAEILYSVFPGMELIYRDIHARSCREARGGSGERLEIHHCLEGRVEYMMNSRKALLSMLSIRKATAMTRIPSRGMCLSWTNVQ